MYCTECLPKKSVLSAGRTPAVFQQPARFLPLLLLAVLTGCTAVSTRGPVTGTATANDTLNTSAEQEIELYRQAITALNDSKLEQAETGFKTIAKDRPEFAGPWINLALIDIRKKNLAGAEKNLAKALERNPQMPQIYNMLGFIDLSKGEINKAADDYRHAIALKEDYAMAHYNLALLQDIYLQDIGMAVQHYKRYLELTNHQDKKTEDWVLELERNLARKTQ
jgi:tetratricopeptide (TPR) repeat protein